MHSEGVINSDQKLPFADQFYSSCLGWGRGQWNYPSATETSFVSTGMDRALAARKPECETSQKGSRRWVSQAWRCAPGRPAVL